MEVFEVKSGDTFQQTNALLINEVAQDLTNITIRCHLRTPKGVWAATCTITKLDNNPPDGTKMAYTVVLSPVQTALLHGIFHADIEYTYADGTKDTTPTFQITISDKITQLSPA